MLSNDANSQLSTTSLLGLGKITSTGLQSGVVITAGKLSNGQSANIGASSSTTVTLNVHEVEFPLQSVATNVTVETPSNAIPVPITVPDPVPIIDPDPVPGLPVNPEEGPENVSDIVGSVAGIKGPPFTPVSYTHLTLPTKRIV